jgi:hypothetical protein
MGAARDRYWLGMSLQHASASDLAVLLLARTQIKELPKMEQLQGSPGTRNKWIRRAAVTLFSL